MKKIVILILQTLITSAITAQGNCPVPISTGSESVTRKIQSNLGIVRNYEIPWCYKNAKYGIWRWVKDIEDAD